MDYERLKSKRAEEWREKQQQMVANLQSLRSSIAECEDVRQKPDPSVPATFPTVPCPICQETAFYVSRWITVNGRKEKMVCRCVQCDHRGTYDWTLNRWLGL